MMGSGWHDRGSGDRTEAPTARQSAGRSARRRHRSDLLVFALYLALTLVLTYPLVVQMGTAVKDLGDPLTNTWILARNVQQAAAGNLAGFFDANIFYPHRRALAMSEFLIPQSIVAAPVFLISGNPILAYNVVYLLAIATTAFATFLLGRLLTGSASAGFVAGVAFAFNPYFGTHLSHLQVLTAAGIPLTFFFLHKYFESGSTRSLLLFSLAFVMQALGNGYYAIFLTYFGALFIVDQAFRKGWLHKPRFWGQMALHAVVALAALAPFYYQYFALSAEVVGVRGISYQGTAWSFLAASQFNRLYGSLTAELSGPEWRLFSGFLVVGLAALGLLTALCRYRATGGPVPEDRNGAVVRVAIVAYRVAGWIMVAGVLGVALISTTGGVQTVLLSIRVSATSIARSMVAVGAAVVLRMLLVAALGDRVRAGSPALREPQRIYAWMLTLAVILTLGPDGLYRVAYDHLPGVNGLRGPARIHVMSVFCLAILAAFGFEKLRSRLAGRARVLAVIAVPALMCVEQLAIPVPLATVPVNDEIPEVYRWLAQQHGDFAIAEYPMGRRADQSRVYYSIYHSKMLLNGYRSEAIPLLEELQRRAQTFPSEQNVVDLEALGIRFLVVDRRAYLLQGGDVDPRIAELRERLGDRLRPAGDFGRQVVYELTGRLRRSRESFWRLPAPMGVRLDRSGWRALGEPHQEIAERALDGDLSTRWHSRQQAAGDFFELDLGETTAFDALVIDMGDSARDHPRGYRLEVSTDHIDWTLISESARYFPPITEYLKPRPPMILLDAPGTSARYVRMTQTGRDRAYDWSIFELNLLRR